MVYNAAVGKIAHADIDRAVYESVEYDKLRFNNPQFRRLRNESSSPHYSPLLPHSARKAINYQSQIRAPTISL